MKTSRQPVRSLFPIKTGARIASPAFALLFALALFANDGSAQRAAQAKAQENRDAAASGAPSGRSIIRGRVFYEETGQPLRQAQVIVAQIPLGLQQQQTTTTNERGEFSVRNLTAGKYQVMVYAPDIIDPYPIPVDEGQASRPTVTVDGASSAEVQVRVRRGGSITGRVTRADGKPASGAVITLMTKRDGRLKPFILREGLRTNEQGLYRASGLLTGEYIVSAGQARKDAVDTEDKEGTGRVVHGMLIATLYPSATDIRNAATVHVDAGGETSGINITLLARTTYKLSGTIRTRRGVPPPGRASISLQSVDTPSNPSAMYQLNEIDAQGRWRFDDVPEGTYIISVSSNGERPPNVKGNGDRESHDEELLYPFIYKRQEVKVAGADVTGLVIEVQSGASISGTVEMENGQPLPAHLSIGPEADFAVQSSSRVSADGKFKLNGVPPGDVHLYLSSTSFGETTMTIRFGEYYVKSIYVGGAELGREPLKVDEGGELKNVRLVLSKEVATLTGHVRSASDGQPARGVNVALLPAEPSRQRIGKGIPYGFTNAAGAFSASAAPGEYLVIAFGESNLPLTDEKARALAASAPRITLQPNERKSLDLTMASSK